MSTEEQSESTATPTDKDKSGVKQHERLIGIQAGRGLAALLVVLYHASRMISLPQYAGRVAFGGGLQFGHAGVDFFFVLSGFIIYFVHNRDIGKPDRLLRYGWRRVTRIYRKALTALGRDFFADEKNLNLMSAKTLAQAATDAGLSNFKITSLSLLGLPTNLLLFARR